MTQDPPQNQPPSQDKSLIKKDKSAPQAVAGKALSVVRNIQATITAYEQKAGKEKIPNASLIYGVGAAILFALSLYHFLMGGWAVGLLVFLIASALLGFSFYYMRLI